VFLILNLSRYGGGPKIEREVIIENDNKKVEVHLLRLQVYVAKKNGQFEAGLPNRSFVCSKLTKVFTIIYSKL
jgi:hypothetical protein